MSDDHYSIILDDGPRIPVREVGFYAPRRSEFLGSAIPEKVHIVTRHRPHLQIEPMRLRLDRGGLTMLDTTAQLRSVTHVDSGDTLMEFELDGGKS